MNKKFKQFLAVLTTGVLSVGTAGMLTACGSDAKDKGYDNDHDSTVNCTEHYDYKDNLTGVDTPDGKCDRCGVYYYTPETPNAGNDNKPGNTPGDDEQEQPVVYGHVPTVGDAYVCQTVTFQWDDTTDQDDEDAVAMAENGKSFTESFVADTYAAADDTYFTVDDETKITWTVNSDEATQDYTFTVSDEQDKVTLTANQKSTVLTIKDDTLTISGDVADMFWDGAHPYGESLSGTCTIVFALGEAPQVTPEIVDTNALVGNEYYLEDVGVMWHRIPLTPDEIKAAILYGTSANMEIMFFTGGSGYYLGNKLVIESNDEIKHWVISDEHDPYDRFMYDEQPCYTIKGNKLYETVDWDGAKNCPETLVYTIKNNKLLLKFRYSDFGYDKYLPNGLDGTITATFRLK